VVRVKIKLFRFSLIWKYLKRITFSNTLFWNFLRPLYHSRHSAACDQSELTADIVGELRENGISIRHVSEFLSELDQLALVKFVESEYALSPRQSKKSFLEYFEGGDFPREEQILDLTNPLHSAAINEAILRPVSQYLGYKSHLCYVELNRTRPEKLAVNKLQFSQNYHRDPGIKNCVKVFIYFNEVTAGSGPFTFIKKTQRGGKKEDLVPSRKRIAGSYYPNQQELQALRCEKPIVCEGGLGTVIFCDTTGWHFGGRSYDKERKMATFVYYPSFDNVSSRFFCQAYDNPKLSDLQKEFLKKQPLFKI
jgi:hypothetical protein